MKKLSIEQKAKAYDEALERAKEIIECSKSDTKEVRMVLSFFPELKESENGRIINRIKKAVEQYWSDEPLEEILAWLEKQGEQKPAECPLHCEMPNWADCPNFEQKIEWSEEDEQLYNDLSDTYFYNDEDYPEETYKLMLKRVLDWMTKRAKSLRPQSTWKPTEQQMKVLNEVINFAADHGTMRWNDYIYNVLKGLREQLKKLRDE